MVTTGGLYAGLLLQSRRHLCDSLDHDEGFWFLRPDSPFTVFDAGRERILDGPSR